MMTYLRFKKCEDNNTVITHEESDSIEYYIGKDALVNVKFNNSAYQIRVTGSYLDEDIVFNNCTDLNAIICDKDETSRSLYDWFTGDIPYWLYGSFIINAKDNVSINILFVNNSLPKIDDIIHMDHYVWIYAGGHPYIQVGNRQDIYDIVVKNNDKNYTIKLLNCDLHKIYTIYENCLSPSLHSYAMFDYIPDWLEFADGIVEKIKGESKEMTNESMLELEEKQPDMNQITQMVLNNADKLYYLLDEYNDAKEELARIETEIKSVLTGGDD